MISINDLKGFDFSKKYYGPTEKYEIITENYEFRTKPDIYESLISGLEFEFRSEHYSLDGRTSEILPIKVLNNQLSIMKQDEFKISKLIELFGNSNVNVGELYNKLSREYRMYANLAIFRSHGAAIENVELLKDIEDKLYKSFEENDDKTVENLHENLSKIINIEDKYFYWEIFRFFLEKPDLTKKRKYVSLKFNDNLYHDEIMEIIDDCFKIHDEHEKRILIKEISPYCEIERVNVDELLEERFGDSYRYKLIDKSIAFDEILGEHELECDVNDVISIMDLGVVQSIRASDYDLESLKEESVLETQNIDFKLAYIKYLSLVDSQHNNYMDKAHFFDSCPANQNVFVACNGIYFPIDILKEVALYKNHVYESNGVGVLRFKSMVVDIKEVAGKYDLKKSGNKEELIGRILDNLSIDEINREFKGKRFSLTEEGENLLNEFKHYNFDYFNSLPYGFSVHDVLQIYDLNNEYSIEDIIYALTIHDWIMMEDESLFSKKTLRSLKFDVNQQRFRLANAFKKEFPERSIEIYLKGLEYQFNAYYVEELCKVFHNLKRYDDERNVLLRYINKLENRIAFHEIAESDEREIRSSVKKIISNLDELNQDALENIHLDDIKELVLEFNDICEFESAIECVNLFEKINEFLNEISNSFYEKRDMESIDNLNVIDFELSKINKVVEQYDVMGSDHFVSDYNRLNKRLEKLPK